MQTQLELHDFFNKKINIRAREPMAFQTTKWSYILINVVRKMCTLKNKS